MFTTLFTRLHIWCIQTYICKMWGNCTSAHDTSLCHMSCWYFHTYWSHTSSSLPLLPFYIFLGALLLVHKCGKYWLNVCILGSSCSSVMSWIWQTNFQLHVSVTDILPMHGQSGKTSAWPQIQLRCLLLWLDICLNSVCTHSQTFVSLCSLAVCCFPVLQESYRWGIDVYFCYFVFGSWPHFVLSTLHSVYVSWVPCSRLKMCHTQKSFTHHESVVRLKIVLSSNVFPSGDLFLKVVIFSWEIFVSFFTVFHCP